MSVDLPYCHITPLTRTRSPYTCYSHQSRVLQVDGNDRSHSEGRVKAELLAADQRVQQLEADNSSLRRRLAEVADSKGKCESVSCHDRSDEP